MIQPGQWERRKEMEGGMALVLKQKPQHKTKGHKEKTPPTAFWVILALKGCQHPHQTWGTVFLGCLDKTLTFHWQFRLWFCSESEGLEGPAPRGQVELVTSYFNIPLGFSASQVLL